MSPAEAVIAEVRGEYAPDPRSAVLEVSLEPGPDALVLRGQTTVPAAMDALVRRLATIHGVDGLVDAVMRLPAPGEAQMHALVRSGTAPLYAEPALASAMVSQLVMGHRVELLERRGAWWRLRSEDGYLGWTHHGYLVEGEQEWAAAWERGAAGEPVVSLGAELADEEDRILARLPWGARLFAESPGRLLLPDGRRGTLASGEVVTVNRLSDRFPARPESLTRTARRWIGTPYLWGGVTPAGADCSGFVQAVFWIHGIALPRDSDLQARTGAHVEMGDNDWQVLRAGDLVFFAEKADVVSHVGLALGGGMLIHSSLSNGGVQINDLAGDTLIEGELRSIFVRARRYLPD